MWRSSSRSIKSIFCKLQCSHKNVTTRETRNIGGVNFFRKLCPTLFGHSYRPFGCSGQGSFARNDNKENPETDKTNFLKEVPSFLSVLSVSGLCALGMYIIQPFHHRRVAFSQEQSRKCAFDIFSKFTLNDYLQALSYFKYNQPFLHVLPQTEGTKRKKKDTIHGNKISDIQLDELEKAHRAVMGSLCNFQGADCMDKQKFTEAIGHFEEAAQFQNPAGIYNLGVCYEAGLGTNQDFNKAAELYKRASDLGHPTATYNLGVFYVHGLGDLKADLNEARKLFRIAAGQGQTNAQKALDMENSNDTIEVLKTDEQSKVSRNSSEKNVDLSGRKHNSIDEFSLFNNNSIGAFMHSKAELKSCPSDDSGAYDLSPMAQALIT